MEKFRSIYRYIKRKYDLLAFRKYTTIAGTLVFFFIMSIVPLSFWLTLIIGKLPFDADRLLRLSVFDSVKSVFEYVQQEAASATTGASVILIVTSLYSATNLFYQMRRSGEIIYDFRKKREGLKLRISALVLLIIVMASAVAFLLIFAIGSFLFSRLLGGVWEKLADYLLLITVAFLLVLLLNMYICPHKTKMRNFIPGTCLTVGAWVLAIVGFSVYLKVGNITRLYGALSTLIIFFLWLYILMICFVIGAIFNSEKILLEVAQGNAKRKPSRKRKGKKTA
jgi:membrane protein